MAARSKWNALLDMPVGETHVLNEAINYNNAKTSVYRLHCTTKARFRLSHAQGRLLVHRLPDADAPHVPNSGYSSVLSEPVLAGPADQALLNDGSPLGDAVMPGAGEPRSVQQARSDADWLAMLEALEVGEAIDVSGVGGLSLMSRFSRYMPHSGGVSMHGTFTVELEQPDRATKLLRRVA